MGTSGVEDTEHDEPSGVEKNLSPHWTSGLLATVWTTALLTAVQRSMQLVVFAHTLPALAPASAPKSQIPAYSMRRLSMIIPGAGPPGSAQTR
jgi:hypothetical protein